MDQKPDPYSSTAPPSSSRSLPNFPVTDYNTSMSSLAPDQADLTGHQINSGNNSYIYGVPGSAVMHAPHPLRPMPFNQVSTDYRSTQLTDGFTQYPTPTSPPTRSRTSTDASANLSTLASYPLPSTYPSSGPSSSIYPSSSAYPTVSTSALSPRVRASSPTSAGRTYICDICSQTFTRAHDRKRHREIHTRVAGQGHVCPYCHKSFSRQDALKRHIDNGCDAMTDEQWTQHINANSTV